RIGPTLRRAEADARWADRDGCRRAHDKRHAHEPRAIARDARYHGYGGRVRALDEAPSRGPEREGGGRIWLVQDGSEPAGGLPRAIADRARHQPAQRAAAAVRDIDRLRWRIGPTLRRAEAHARRAQGNRGSRPYHKRHTH